jgi:hypothetical protein
MPRQHCGDDGGDVHPYQYQITISGGLGEIGREAFSDFKIESDDLTTVLTADLDQAALYGALNRILSLGFELIELNRLVDGGGNGVSRSAWPA